MESSKVPHASRMPLYKGPCNMVEFKAQNACKNSLERKQSTWFQLLKNYHSLLTQLDSTCRSCVFKSSNRDALEPDSVMCRTGKASINCLD